VPLHSRLKQHDPVLTQIFVPHHTFCSFDDPLTPTLSPKGEREISYQSSGSTRTIEAP